jgi:molybdate transport system substrate-binding protein
MSSVVVQCTNGIKEAMLELTPAFERQQKVTLDVAYGSTKMIMESLAAGAAADLVILTSEAVEELIQQGTVRAGSRVDVALSGIGVAVRQGAPKPDISSADALKRAMLAARKVSYSSVGASGLYVSSTVIPRLGIVEEMKTRALIPKPGSFVGPLLASGEADIGFQQISELMPVAGIEIVGPLPPELQKMTIFAAGVCSAAKAPDAAKALAAYLAAPGALPVMKKHGLEAV